MWVGESAVWYRDGSWLELDMPLDLAPLAYHAVPIAIRVMDLAICGQKNLVVMRRHIAHTQGGERSAVTENLFVRICVGTGGQNPCLKRPLVRKLCPQLGR